MKKEVQKKGMSAHREQPFQKAYSTASKYIFIDCVKYKDNHLDDIKKEAQKYLTEQYEVMLANINAQKIIQFVDMPKLYVKIDVLYKETQKYSLDLSIKELQKKQEKELESLSEKYGFSTSVTKTVNKTLKVNGASAPTSAASDVALVKPKDKKGKLGK